MLLGLAALAAARSNLSKSRLIHNQSRNGAISPKIRLKEDFSIPLNSSAQTRELPQGSTSVGQPPAEHMVWIPGGAFLMGSNDHYPEEAPAHSVTVNGFWMDQCTVTNEEWTSASSIRPDTSR